MFVRKVSAGLMLVVIACFFAIPVIGQTQPTWFGQQGGGGGGLSSGTADTTYLRLDASNDPLTAQLEVDDLGIAIGPGGGIIDDQSIPGNVEIKSVNHGIASLWAQGTTGYSQLRANNAYFRLAWDEAQLINLSVFDIGTSWTFDETNDTIDGNAADGSDAFVFDVVNAHTSGDLFSWQEAGVDVLHLRYDGVLHPQGNGTQDLGLNANAWRRIYVNNIAAQGTANVDFEDDLNLSTGIVESTVANGTEAFSFNVMTNHTSGNLFEVLETGVDAFIIDATANVLPGVTGAKNLGSSSLRWNNMWLNNLGATGAEVSMVWTSGLDDADGTISFGASLVPDADASLNIGSVSDAVNVVYLRTLSADIGQSIDFQDNIAPISDDTYDVGAGVAGMSGVFTHELTLGTRHIGTAPSALPACSSALLGQLLFFEDSNDSKEGGPCWCVLNADNTTYGWKPGTATGGCS